jgi:hypothetical protein
MSSGSIQKLNALLKRVEERRVQPRLVARPAALSPARAAPAHTTLAGVGAASDSDLFAATIPPEAPTIAPAASLPPAARTPSLRPETAAGEAARRGPASPLEDAMAQLGAGREDSGPLQVEPMAATPIRSLARPSLAEPQVNQDLVLTHRPEAGPGDHGPIVELIQPKAPTVREPTLQFDTGVKANPLTQRDLKPAGLGEPVAESPLTAPTEKLEPAPLSAHAAPARVVSSARRETAKTFGELLELSLALRPAPR